MNVSPLLCSIVGFLGHTVFNYESFTLFFLHLQYSRLTGGNKDSFTALLVTSRLTAGNKDLALEGLRSQWHSLEMYTLHSNVLKISFDQQ